MAEFWHCRCVSEKSERAFTSKYLRWCRKHGYNFSEAKAHTIHAEAGGRIDVMPKSETTKLPVEHAVAQFRVTSAALAALKIIGFHAVGISRYQIVLQNRLHPGILPVLAVAVLH